ncbi:MAG: type II toxin-antitoxin system Phd/YefM family antitoxin [Phycisphaerales bacterium]|nr:type II toxin-antitoxin system Phd/YefM family antitoxin [Phycisphaerales bacterium]
MDIISNVTIADQLEPVERKWKKVDVSEARKLFANLISEVGYGHDRTVLCRNGKPLVAMIPLDDLRFLEKLEDQYDLNAVNQSMKDQVSIAPKEAKKQKKQLNLKT